MHVAFRNRLAERKATIQFNVPGYSHPKLPLLAAGRVSDLGLYYKIPRRRISGVRTGNRELESRYGKVYNRAKKCDQKNENMIKRRVSASLFIQAYFPQASSVGRTRLPAVLISGTGIPRDKRKPPFPTLFLLGKFHNNCTLNLMLPLYPDYGQGLGITTLFPLGASVGIVFEIERNTHRIDALICRDKTNRPEAVR